ncbi:hypothetical protein QFZ35_002949 [Arthrobacter ulcerisalmonis]|nr:hypothetical protein [Arthrobacter ulcerisalmonis]MDQ0664451.1 hypothetical protein [Arthrobacter ulcerisalmonis]
MLRSPGPAPDLAGLARPEPTHGPLAATAAELSRTARLRAPRQHGKPVALPAIAGTATLFMAASSTNKTAAQTALMVQLINTAFAEYEMHAQSWRAREAQRIRAVVENVLAPFTATMPKPVPNAKVPPWFPATHAMD